MDVLQNPNVAYLVLVTAFVLSILAVLVPGTGMLELGALFLLVLAAWEVYSLPINPWALIVLVLGVLPFLLAVRRTRRRGYLLVSVLSLVVGSLYLFRGERWYLPSVHPLLAVLVSASTALFFWLVAIKVMAAEHLAPQHDVDRLLGKVGEARTPIHLEGSVQVESELWSARAAQPIPAGTPVRVVGREGFVLVVEPVLDEAG